MEQSLTPPDISGTYPASAPAHAAARDAFTSIHPRSSIMTARLALHARSLRMAAAAACALVLAAPAWAGGSAAGYWKVTHFDFATGRLVNVVYTCLAPDGTLTEDIWTGAWTQSGDRVLTHATSSDQGSVFADSVTMFGKDAMSGYDQSWNPIAQQAEFYTTEVWQRLPPGPGCGK
jgi:hypothetical protein